MATLGTVIAYASTAIMVTVLSCRDGRHRGRMFRAPWELAGTPTRVRAQNRRCQNNGELIHGERSHESLALGNKCLLGSSVPMSDR